MSQIRRRRMLGQHSEAVLSQEGEQAEAAGRAEIPRRIGRLRCFFFDYRDQDTTRRR